MNLKKEVTMSGILYKANFGNVRFKLIQRKGNAFCQPELQPHFHPGYRLGIFTTLPGHGRLRAGFWPVKFVLMKSGSDLDFKSRHFGSTFSLVYEHEVLLDVLYRQTESADEFMLLFYNLSNNLTRRQGLFIKHKSVPPVAIY